MFMSVFLVEALTKSDKFLLRLKPNTSYVSV